MAAPEAALQAVANYVALGVEGVALLVIAVGSIEALMGIIRLQFVHDERNAARRAVWLNYAHWLVAGLTFQLAADIVRTTVAPSWEDIGQLAAIAGIRTFLTFFLDRDIEAESRRSGGHDAKSR